MYGTIRQKPSRLTEAVNKLNKLHSDSHWENADLPHIPLAISASRLTAYLTNYIDEIKFLPNFDIYETYATLRAANNVWRRDGLSALAVCALPSSTGHLEEATDIKAVSIDQFLSDTKQAHRIVPPSTGKPRYVVRTLNGPNRASDRIVVPSQVNLLIFQPNALSKDQLDSLYDHVMGVRGKAIFCDHPERLQVIYPDLGAALRDTYRNAMSPKLVNDPLPPYGTPDQQDNAQALSPKEQDRFLPDSSTSNLRYNQGTYFVCHQEGNRHRLVATVRTDSIYKALSLTQHFESPWPENSGVDCFIDKPRSTAAGDIIVHEGSAQRFDGTGFSPVANPIGQELVPAPSHAPTLDGPNQEVPKPDRQLFKIHF